MKRQETTETCANAELSPENAAAELLADFDRRMPALIGEMRRRLRLEESPQKEEQLRQFFRLVLLANQTVNLTAIVKAEDMATLHLLDSLMLLETIDQEKKKQLGALSFLDMGTGAGFPAIPVKIERPDLDLTMVDALQKRVRFLEKSAATIALSAPWRALHGRAEELASDGKLRGQFAVVTARAVADLRVLAEYCLPFVQTGGVFIAMKTDDADELRKAENAIRVLGAKLEECRSFVLPETEIRRSLILIRKLKATERRYPRKPAKIKQSPL